MKQLTRKHSCILTIVLSLLLLFVFWIIWGNTTIKATIFHIHDANLPKGFDGYRIAQISDLHNAKFGSNNAGLLYMLRQQHPDIIVMTGDLVDSNHTDMDTAISFAAHAAEIAPCYYVTGNHEAWLKEEYDVLEKDLRACGVTVLRNQTDSLHANGDTLHLIGIDDPDFTESGNGLFDLTAGIIQAEIQNTAAPEGYKILLSHRPEVFETYVENNINLAFSGHAHGGQFRLPFIGGLIAPNQGFLPKYDGGVYQEGNTTMVVSRGIGNSIIPVRFNNRPEIVIAVLHCDP